MDADRSEFEDELYVQKTADKDRIFEVFFRLLLTKLRLRGFHEILGQCVRVSRLFTAVCTGFLDAAEYVH